MRETKISRRVTLQLLGSLPVLSAFAACGGKNEPDSCNDVSGLNDGEKAGRAALQYVDRSTFADKHCNNCNLYQPASQPTQCGGCQVVKGPIHPSGYCTAWVQKG